MGRVLLVTCRNPFSHTAMAVAGGLGERREVGPHHRLLDRTHVSPVLNQVRHLEEPELIDLRGHHRGRQRELHGAELDLLQQQLVTTQLARSVDDDLVAIEPLVGTTRELLRGEREQRARLAHMAELQLPGPSGLPGARRDQQ